MHVFNYIKNELDEASSMLHKEFHIKAGYLHDFARVDPGGLDNSLRPGAVILTGKIFKGSTHCISLAAIVQFIYLASFVHARISETDDKDTPGIDPRDGSQYPVLVGDYLYGKFFTTLCSAGIVKYLKPLSEVICHINEGAILRHRNRGIDAGDSMYYKIIYLETASLFETGCRLAAELSGAGKEDCINMAGAGRGLGMAYGLIYNNLNSDYTVNYLKDAARCLSRVPKNSYTDIFFELLSKLNSYISGNSYHQDVKEARI